MHWLMGTFPQLKALKNRVLYSNQLPLQQKVAINPKVVAKNWTKSIWYVSTIAVTFTCM
jgi:hypothetical protein